MVDYVLTPVRVPTLDIPVKYDKVVNDLWLEMAIQQNACVEIEYWHKPVVYPEDSVTPLTDKDRICVSSYYGQERMFVRAVAEMLGAFVADEYAKKHAPILVCPSAEGVKYGFAKKWNLPVVTKDWLLGCLDKKVRLPFDDYIVGPKPEPESPSLLESSLDPQVAAKEPTNDPCLPMENFSPLILNHKRLDELK